MTRSLLFLCILGAAACGDDGGGGGTIGPEGGTVVSDDGLFTLTVPAGALSSPVDIRITHTGVDDLEEPTGIPLETGYLLEPDGLVFEVPASFEMSLAHEPETAPGSVSVGSREMWLESSGAVEPVPDQRLDLDLDAAVARIRGTIPHFSRWAVGGPARVDLGLRGYVNYPERLCIGETGTIELAVTRYLPGSDFVNREPPVWEVIDALSMAQLDGGRFSASIEDSPAGRPTQAVSVTCSGGEGSITLAVRLEVPYEHYEDPTRPTFTAGIFLGDITIICEPCETSVAEGTFDLFPGVEGVITIDSGAWGVTNPIFDDDLYALIAGTGGEMIARLSDGTIAHDLAVHSTQVYQATAANNSIVSVGPDGYSDRRYAAATGMFGFAQLGLLGQNLTDLAVIVNPAGNVHGILIANNSVDQVERLDPVMDAFGGFTLRATPALSQADLAAVTGEVVSVYSPPGEGPFLGVSNSNTPGVEGVAFWVDPADPAGLTVIGNVGEGPRRIRCMGRWCGISAYTVGTMTALDWPDRSVPPTILGSVPVDGPVGLDVAMVAGMPAFGSTGFRDGTLHVTRLASQGPVLVDQEIVLTNCNGPGHVAFSPDGLYAIVTCNGDGTYQALLLPAPP